MNTHLVRRLSLIFVAGVILYAVSIGLAQQQISVPALSTHRTTKLEAALSSPNVPSAASPGPAASTSPSAGSDPATTPAGPPVSPLQTTVQVNATRQILESGVSAPYQVRQEEVLSSAGTWGDFSRYLQLLPGVVWNTDMSNDIMVRGGNPTENLFVVDGIEVPNINHLAMEGTTGGFTSMIDTTSIRSVDMKAGVYDASYSSRLSSLIEIHTRDAQPGARGQEVDLGISGVGGTFLRPIGTTGDVQLSAHRSILNLATNDIGINGVPIYTDGMAKMEWSPGSKDHLRALSLNGDDSIDIRPEPCDSGVTLNVQTQYQGGRSTSGLVWQHTHSPQSISTFTASYSAQSQVIGQQAQSTAYPNNWVGCKTHPYQTTPMYSERTNDSTATLKYGFEVNRGKWAYTAGATGQLLQFDYAVQQPLGQHSPFNPDPAWTDSDSFARALLVGQSAAYAEGAGPIGTRLNAMLAIREETFALTGARAFEPRASLALRINERQTINSTYAQAFQSAPSIDILSYPGNGLLRPTQVKQFSLGAGLWRTDWMTLSVEAYRKLYSDEPVSTEYPGLMLANMVDMLGQQFVWLPLKSEGRGRSEGIELLLRAHAADRFQILGSASYSRTRYAAADGVLRPGNFDFPLVANGMVTLRLPWKLQLAVRDTYASGRPYTPFDIALSEQQARGIYDLKQINAMRGPAYNRVDADVNRNFTLRYGLLNLRGGLENALDRQNFLGYAWEGSCGASVGAYCGLNVNAIPGVPETKVTQMPLFPSAGLRYRF